MKGGVAGRNRQAQLNVNWATQREANSDRGRVATGNRRTCERSRPSGNKCIVITSFKTAPGCLVRRHHSRSLDREKGQRDGPRGRPPSRTHTYTVAHTLPALPKGLNWTKLCCQVSFVWGKKSLVVITGKNNRLFVKFWWIALFVWSFYTLMYVGFMKNKVFRMAKRTQSERNRRRNWGYQSSLGQTVAIMKGTGGDTSAVFLKQKWGQGVEPLNSSEKSICCWFFFFTADPVRGQGWVSVGGIVKRTGLKGSVHFVLVASGTINISPPLILAHYSPRKQFAAHRAHVDNCRPEGRGGGSKCARSHTDSREMRVIFTRGL